MRVFEKFNQGAGKTCPVCKTDKETEVVLVPIPGTEDGNNMQAHQVHKKCHDLILEMNNIEPEEYEY